MKQQITLLFFAFLLLYTEGSLAQGVLTPKDMQPSISDSIEQYIADDSIENMPIVPRKNYVNPYADAQKKYLSEPIDAQKIDNDRWEKAKAGIDYSGDQMKKEKQASGSSLNPKWIIGLFEFFKWFFIVGAIVLLAYLILRFVGEGNIFGPRKRSISDPSVQIDLERIEENLETADIDPLILRAIADKNYSLAVRLYYLAILKELHLKGDIAWKKDKTNRAYVREMREHRFFEPFRKTTTVFERVWYGSQTIDERTFEVVQPDFQSLLKSMK